MKMGTEEFYEAIRALHTPLWPYNNHPKGCGHGKDDRLVTTKTRMRKDRVAVMTLVCWKNRWKESEDEIPLNEPLHKALFVRTTALTVENAVLIGQTLTDYLETGNEPTAIMDMPMYPGYEDIDNRKFR
jgi:hypothetical protein